MTILKRTAVRFIADDRALFVPGLAWPVLDGAAARSTAWKGNASSHWFTHVAIFFFCLFAFLSIQHFVIIANSDYRNPSCGGKCRRVDSDGGLEGPRTHFFKGKTRAKFWIITKGGGGRRVDRETQRMSEVSPSRENCSFVTMYTMHTV